MSVESDAAAQITQLLGGRIGASLLLVEQPQPDTLRFEIDPGAVRAAAKALVQDTPARYLITVGIDERPLDRGFAIVHLFSLDSEHLFLALDCAVDSENTRIDAITPIVPGANWAEREFRDAIGVEPEGHPDPRRLMLPDDWPEGVYPLRRDFRYDYHPPSAGNVRPVLREPPKGSSVIPMGPFFPTLEEPAHWRLFVEGEKIVGCDYRGFYNHRAIEKLGDSAMTYDKLPFLAERICGICGFIHSTCCCQALEKAIGIQAPARARYIRTIMLELERIHSHLLWLGIAAHIVGFETLLMQSWRIREPVMWLTEEISGNRKTYGMNCVGGLRRDIPADLTAKIQEVLLPVERELRAVRQAIVGDTTILARTKGVGVLTRQWAEQIAVVGPPARASGIAIDARVDHPYAAYDEVPARICVQEGSDIWARVVVRMDELEESLRLIRAATAAMPGGPIRTEIAEEIPPGRIGISVVEAPRGEAVHFVMTGGDNRPYRWRVRAPTYPNLQAVPAMVQGETVADVPITVGSLDPCFSCTERVEAVDIRNAKTRVYSREELLRMWQEKSAPGGER
ncbi:MAG: NADH-quinone oxidoreductase subunit C [Gemmatimonadota bacterium]|nr:MAG: NADH-quinone oxidoreductase subunit C [Gemmatimonadota bacterium]